MKVKLLKDFGAGKAGVELSGPEVWRMAFPLKGFVAKAADAESAARILEEIQSVREPGPRQRLEQALRQAGTYPEERKPSEKRHDEQVKAAEKAIEEKKGS